MIKHIFYKTICLVNNKYYYGVHAVTGSVDNDKYLGSGVDLVKDIEKYGEDKFIRFVIMESYDKHLVNLAEAYYVRTDEVNDPMCYNKILGGTDENFSINFKENIRDESFMINFNRKKQQSNILTINQHIPVEVYKPDKKVIISPVRNELITPVRTKETEELIERARIIRDIKSLEKEQESLDNRKRKYKVIVCDKCLSVHNYQHIISDTCSSSIQENT